MNHQSHIFPFLWVKGEAIERVKEEIKRIKESHIDEFVVESRTHPHFLQEQWWKDFESILQYASELDMKVWLLDDAHFPTGYANGAIRRHPELRKQYLFFSSVDIYSEGFEVTLNLELMRKPKRKWSDRNRPEAYYQSLEDNNIQAIVAYPLLKNRTISENGIDLSQFRNQQFLDCNLPPGTWRVYVLYTTYENGGQADYIDMLQSNSVRLLIDTVYEPHFDHFKAYFGTVFRGFFSDEPGFGNTTGFSKDEIIGQKDMALPWSQELAEIFHNEALSLPLLWATSREASLSRSIRLRYMNAITDLYRENFSQQLGKWCCERGVEYIGHIIEDNNMHARLGTGAGHYFKAMEGQTMAGIDIISSQLTIGGDETWRTNSSQNDGPFYQYCLPKLADSSAQLDPVKQGQAFCELYGAFGWQLSIRNMKWILDSLLVRGVTNFVPHAFSMDLFPDLDSPPHFYANGFNPQFPLFKKLMEYMGEVSNIISGGVSTAKVAILYHGELEWTGRYMKMQVPSMELSQSQIDFLYVPSHWMKEIVVSENGFVLHYHYFEKFIIPQTEVIPKAVYDAIQLLPKESVVFLNERPGLVVEEQATVVVDLSAYPCVALTELTDTLQHYRLTRSYQKGMKLGARHQIKEGKTYLILHNESLFEQYTIQLPDGYQRFNLQSGQLDVITPIQTLSPYQMEVYQWVGVNEASLINDSQLLERVSFHEPWEINLLSPSGKRVAFKIADELPNLAKEFPTFSGTIIYRNSFEIPRITNLTLQIDRVFDGVIVKVNGEEVSTLITPPYNLPISSQLKIGHNDIELIVPTTADRQLFDEKLLINQFEPMEPIGIVGRVELVKYV